MKTVVADLQRVIESQHGGRATFAQSVPVTETHNGQTVWQGVVHVFDLEDHPKATRAYAWSSPTDGADQVASGRGAGGDRGGA
jgi:hypothetical protein